MIRNGTLVVRLVIKNIISSSLPVQRALKFSATRETHKFMDYSLGLKNKKKGSGVMLKTLVINYTCSFGNSLAEKANNNSTCNITVIRESNI